MADLEHHPAEFRDRQRGPRDAFGGRSGPVMTSCRRPRATAPSCSAGCRWGMVQTAPASRASTTRVPAEALSDPEFAAMLEEAEKVSGHPVMFGAARRRKRVFDCSGYVCWVLNQSGWDVGRTTANGLWQQAAKVSEHEAQAGRPGLFPGHLRHPRREPCRAVCGATA